MAIIKLTRGLSGDPEWVNTDQIIRWHDRTEKAGSYVFFDKGPTAKGRHYLEGADEIAQKIVTASEP